MDTTLFRANLLISLALTCVVSLGCSHNVQIPPSRPMALEGPATLGAKRTSARVQVASHGMMFNGDFNSGNLRLRSGRTENLELSLDGSVINPQDGLSSDLNMYVGRAGAKLNTGKSKHLAVTAGVGGGYSPAGGAMVSADGGLTLGYNNRLLIPFASARTFMSAPIDARPVQTGDMPEHIDTPTLTAGSGVGVGLAVAIDKVTATLGSELTVIRDEDGTESVLSVGFALEFSLD